MKPTSITVAVVTALSFAVPMVAQVQDPPSSGARGFVGALILSIDDSLAAPAESVVRFIDADRLSTLLSRVFPDSVPPGLIRRILPGGYRSARVDEVLECPSQGGPPCTVAEGGVWLAIDTLYRESSRVLVVLTEVRNSRIRPGSDAERYKMWFQLREGGWTLVGRRLILRS